MYVFIVKSKIKGLFTNVHDLLLHICKADATFTRYKYVFCICFQLIGIRLVDPYAFSRRF